VANRSNKLVERLKAVASDGEVIDFAKTINLTPSALRDRSAYDASQQPPNEYLGVPRKSIHAAKENERPFEIIVGEHIDSGGMADVDAAIQISLSREVVIKRVKLGMEAPENFDALRREAIIMGKLEHPNIPPVHELAFADGVPLVIMKRIRGTKWDCHTAASNRESLLVDLQILVQVCRAVEYAHSKGIVHLDLKPENVMIGDFGEVCLLDWGCAAEVDENGHYLASGFHGTPSYAAPEMVEGDEPLMYQTDVYLLGATLHHLLTGQGPHTGRVFLDVVISALTSAPFEYGAGVDADLTRIAQRATSRIVNDRYQTAAEFREDLEHYIRDFYVPDLMRAARHSLTTLKAALASGKSNFFEFYQHAFQGQFACQKVLELRVGDQQAEQTNSEILQLLARHEIGLGHMLTARQLIKQIRSLPHPDGMVFEVEELYSKAEMERQRAGELTTQIHYKLLEKLQGGDDPQDLL
jgi:serine/threonine-protein kinase